MADHSRTGCFKVPLPIKKTTVSRADQHVDINLPSFSKKEFSDLTIIGRGSFGKVSKARKNGNDFVIKELVIADGFATNICLFKKEAKLLRLVKGHENILQIHAFSLEENAILLDYISFNFKKLGMEQDEVFNLKEFLVTCDLITDFVGFEHTQYHLATDIISGLKFLHQKDIAHRDLKPENILVSNRHMDSKDVVFWWSVRPITAILSDFGEARSSLVQTKCLAQTSTHNLYRGSPAYMAPEAIEAKIHKATLNDLKKMDIWSLGMVFFHLINPDSRHPFSTEIERKNHINPIEALKSYITEKALPEHSEKYKTMRNKSWKELENVYNRCAEFHATRRFDAEMLQSYMVTQFVNVEHLSISQASISEAIDAEKVGGISGVSYHAHRSNTLNACSFLSLMVADRLFKNSPNAVDLSAITQDGILTFPSKVNDVRDSNKMYSVDEAYSILKSCGMVSPLEFQFVISSGNSKSPKEAAMELYKKLYELVDKHVDETVCAVYTSPPYTMLFCKPRQGQLTIIDTHPIPEKFGGSNNAGIITSKYLECTIRCLCSWLLHRTGDKENVLQELAVVFPIIQDTPKSDELTESDMIDGLTCEENVSISPNILHTPNDMATSAELSLTLHSRGKNVTIANSSETTEPNLTKLYKNDVPKEPLDSSTEAEHATAKDGLVKEIVTDVHSGPTGQDCSILETGSVEDTISVSSSDENLEQSFKNPKITTSKTRFKKMEFDPDHWNNVETECVTCLPNDINGLKKFKLECTMQEMMKKTKDGRPWARWYTSSRSGLIGRRRITRCKGSPICKSNTCLYRMKYGSANRSQFQKKNSILVCFTCGSPAECLSCPALKVWEYEEGGGYVTVMHRLNHTCTSKNPKVSTDIIKKEIMQNPNVKPSKLVNDKMVNIMGSENFKWEDVEKVASMFVDVKRLHNIRSQMKIKENPVGQNFEALGLYKQKCDEKDKFFIYKVNNRALNGKPSYAFKSSTSMANLCIEMDKDRNEILKDEYAFIDAKHDHCKDFKTITLWTYHPVLRKVVCLAKMEAEEESSENLKIFWCLLNEMLEEVSGIKEYKFNPFGFIADENCANWLSIKAIFGNAAIHRAFSCEFHYKQSIHRKSRMLSENGEEFIKLGTDILDSLSISEFNRSSAKMEEFIKCNKYDKILNNWFKWWYERRTHIFRAFKIDNAPSSNLAEIGHAKMTSVGRPLMSLLEAAREDVASAMRQTTEIELFQAGLSKGGRGPTENQKRSKEYKAGMKRAKEYSEELDSEEIDLNRQIPLYVQSKGKHRPKENKRMKKNTSALPDAPPRPLAFHLCLFSTIFNLKKCYGCAKDFKEKYKMEPNDLILKHYCHRRFKDKDGNYKVSPDLQAAYFHLKLDCTRKIEPNMEVSDVIIHEEIANVLTEGHKAVLVKFGIRL